MLMNNTNFEVFYCVIFSKFFLISHRLLYINFLLINMFLLKTLFPEGRYKINHTMTEGIILS